jgi:CheY-like chemotaxis protein
VVPLARLSPDRRSPSARAFTPGARGALAVGPAPAARPTLTRPAPALRPAPATSAGRRPAKTVLIIEDDELTREMLTAILEAEGYRSASVANGQEALARLHAEATPDLILLDLWMPVMNGWEFCAVQSQDPLLASVPVVIISATGEEGSGSPAPLTAVAHLRKPITVEELLDIVRRC